MPSPGAARYGLIALLLAATGLFAGQSTYAALHGRAYLTVVQHCETTTESYPAFVRCIAPVEGQKTWYGAGGALAVLLLGLALMPLLPYRLLRRAGPLRRAEAAITERAGLAARRAGLRRTPVVLVGGWRLREPFTVRVLSGIRIIVPPGLRRLPPEQIDAVLAHEMSHVRAGDVTLVWLTRGLWWALLPALVLPQFLTFGRPILQEPRVLVEAPLEIARAIFGHASFWNNALRATVLLVVAAVVASSVLRSREHEADLATGAPGLVPLLSGQPARPRRWWQAAGRLTATHPSARRRIAALHDPARTTELRTVDAAAVGLLAAMAIPALNLSVPIRAEGSIWINATHLTGLITALMIAPAWGIALWRAALAAEVTGRPIRLRRTTLALAAATAAGLVANLGALPGGAGAGFYGSAAMLLCTPVTVGGAAALSGILARTLARRRAGAPWPAPAWRAIVLLNVVLFTGALWLGPDAAAMITARGLGGLAQFVTFSGYYQGCAAGVALLGLLSARWSWHRPTRRRLLAATALVVVPAVAALAVRWLVLTTPAGPNEVVYRDFWAALAASSVVLAVLLAVRGPRGLVPGLALAPVANLLVSAAIWIRYLPIWDNVWTAGWGCLTGSLAMLAPAFLLAALLSSITELRRRPTH
ncbi:hypothetical protein L3i22_081080 [Actinoplanes sp. L3-i22]|nr:hypothetical protein L3i22_081080 [Actinoplanes sp. L3-i22]